MKLIDKICLIAIVMIIFGGVASAAQVWVSEDPAYTAVKYSGLTATIKVTIKNTADHVQYFKMSQAYQGSLADGEYIYWKIAWADPKAVRMIKSRYGELGGDYGWKIPAKSTKTVCFKLYATGRMGSIPVYIVKQDSDNATYWPLINEPGLMASWFSPSELELLNPTLDIKKWKGHFTFNLVKNDSFDEKIEGLVRAPIVPVNSKLTYSSPKAFVDKGTAVDANIATWDVVWAAGSSSSKHFEYTYTWPTSTSGAPPTSSAYSKSISGSSKSSSSSVPTKQTGVPYGLLVVGALVTAAGVGYAKFMRK
ncbi:hypothetical protein [Methanobacterium alcaliphilum]|uniref:hypothetical protein n=1 Tax=Methanobacterium alcaliphilum TaxID=392018 RepID=UPI002009E57C|nr:hypothetical protein [Methanobacterium alcaliphilum]MCK9150391.1 hypothetical protein [Methanobacterium alcaliphilum]